MVLCAVAQRPEINYDGNFLSIGSNPASSSYPFTISGFHGLNWVNGNSYFNIVPRDEGIYIFSGNLPYTEIKSDAEINFVINPK